MASKRSLNIHLPPALGVSLEKHVAEAGLENSSAYVLKLIRSDLRKQARRRIESELVRSMQGGRMEPMTAKDWTEIRRRVRESASRRSRKKAG